LQKLKEALEKIDIAIGLAKNDKQVKTDALINKGSILDDLGKFAEAIECYLEANKLIEKADSYNNMGIVYKK